MVSTLAGRSASLASALRHAAWLMVAPTLVWILIGWRTLESLCVRHYPYILGLTDALAVLIPVVLAVWVTRGSPRVNPQHGARLIGISAGLGLFGLLVLVVQFMTNEVLLDWIWSWAIDHSGHPDCLRSPFYDRRAFLAPGWLGLALLAQAHAVEPFARRGLAPSGLERERVFIAWIVGVTALILTLLAGVVAAFAPRIVELRLLASAPLMAMLAVELSLHGLHRHGLHRLPDPPTARFEQAPRPAPDINRLGAAKDSQGADPAALAQGRRLLRRARAWEAPLWLAGLLAVLGAGLSVVFDDFMNFGTTPWLHDGPELLERFPGLALLVLGAAAILVGLVALRWRSSVEGGLAGRPPAPPSSLAELLAELELGATLLEHDADADFAALLIGLPARVEALSPSERELLRRRELDPALLCQQLLDCWAGAELLEPGPRRSLHHQMRRFAAQAGAQPRDERYRDEVPSAPVASGLEWLGEDRCFHEPSLKAVRRRLVARLLGLAAAGLGLVAILLMDLHHDDSLIVFGLGWLLAFAPPLLWIATLMVRAAGRTSLALALPTPSLEFAARCESEQPPRWEGAKTFAAIFPLVLSGLAVVYIINGHFGSDLEHAMLAGSLVGLGLVSCTNAPRLVERALAPFAAARQRAK